MDTKEFDQFISDKFSTLYSIAVSSYAKLEPILRNRGVIIAKNITPRQQEVLTLLARGFTNKSIAKQLNIKEATVSFHLKEIRINFNCLTNREILPFAYKTGLI